MRSIVAVVAAVMATAAPARGYTLFSPITDDCHERITSAALRNARAQTGNARPLPPDANDAALIDDIPFPLEPDMRDLGGATLVLGISDNDLKGYSSTDEFALVPITADPELQHEHCLRRADQDEPDGSAAALVECRAFIHERVGLALDALGSDGEPDSSKRSELYVYLKIRGSRTRATLPTYYVRMAQALHALEDGFAHSYRTQDQVQPTVVLNWVDQQTGTLVERRDGPAHALPLDSCADIDALRTLRRQVATRAATELLVATLDVSATREQKLAGADAVLTRYLTLQPGCTADNGWCGAPEAMLATQSGCGCQLGAASSPPGGAVILLGLLFAVVVVVGRARRRAGVAAIATVAVAALLLSSTARAQEPVGSQPAVPATAPSDQASVAAGKEPGRDTPTPTAHDIELARAKKRLGPRVGLQLTAAGAVDRAGAAGALGLRVRLTEKWLVGFDVEINPFFSVKSAAVRPGVLNVYGSVVRRYPMTFDRVNLRTTLQAGFSTLLFDLYGAPAGSTGPYVGLSLLGIDVDLGRSLRLVFDPALVTLPVPHVTGQPFYYLQYRVSIGLSWGA